MLTIAPIILALAAQVPSAEGGDAVILETIVTSTAVVEEDAVDVEGFLASQIFDAWGVEVANTPPILEGGRHFYVTLDWRAPTAVLIRVAERDVVHVDRQVEIADPNSGRAILWLSIRSSIERALAAMPPAPTVTEMLDRFVEEAETATSADEAEIVPEPEAEPVPEPTPTPTIVEDVPDGDPMDPRLYASFDRLWARRKAPTEGTLSTTIMMKGGVEGGLAFGPAVQMHYVLGRWLTVGGEIAYYNVAFSDGVEVEHVPLTALVSVQPDLAVPLEFGARATLDLQVVVPTDNAMFGVRMVTGPYARSSLPFYVGDGDQANFVAELRLDFAVARSTYPVPGGTFLDPFFGISGALGVEYRWR